SFLRGRPKVSDKEVTAVLDLLLERYQFLLRRLKGEKIKYRPPKSRIRIEPVLKDEIKRLKEQNQYLETRLREIEKRIESD
ncbi:MAG: hypothetical protein GY940_08455, partial [bacterium]|nr:hypothetical protein [bacterium]